MYTYVQFIYMYIFYYIIYIYIDILYYIILFIHILYIYPYLEMGIPSSIGIYHGHVFRILKMGYIVLTVRGFDSSPYGSGSEWTRPTELGQPF